MCSFGRVFRFSKASYNALTGICMESSECNWVYISKTICPGMLIFGKQAF